MPLPSSATRATRGKGKQVGRPARVAPAPSAPPRSATSNDGQYTTEVYTILSSDKEKTVRQHLMRLQSHQSTDPKDFTPPIKLVKRNVYNRELQEEREAAEAAAKAALEAKAKAEEGGDQVKKEEEREEEEEEDKEKEKEEEAPAAQEDLSNIAPYGGATYNRQNLFQKKTRFVYANREVLNARRQKLRDGQPWMLVDDDRQNIFEGKIQAKQKPNYFLLVIEDGNFRVVRVAKQYRFMRQPSYKTLTAEEAEVAMAKRQKQQTHNRWIMRHKAQEEDVDANETLKPEEASARPFGMRKLITVDARDRDRGGGDEYLDYEGLGTRSDDDEGEQEADREDEDERARKDKWSREVHAADSAAYDIDDMELFGGTVDLNADVKTEEGGEDSDSRMNDTRDLRRLGVEVGMAGKDDSDDSDDPYARAAGVKLKEERAKEREARRQELFMMQPAPQHDEGGGEGGMKEVTVKKEEEGESSGTQSMSSKVKGGGQSSGSGSTHTPQSPSSSGSFNKRSRSEEESEGMSGGNREKKKKREETGDSDAHLITEEDVVQVIQSAKLTPKEVVNRLRLKLQKDPRNKKQAYKIILQVASLQNGVLVLNKKP
ncbi:MAG: transcription initiation factor IIF, alpha subunit (TFIIF-alpha)-domain-containing protein [Piptocephalis tieghemiana]|nr:MAG: transcription initiation factor IIF, alpha subunit (TFIIF-alpha)-domain-containing protein [Piptocephalis tieghemiana]